MESCINLVDAHISELPPDPLVETHREKQRALREWHRRVKEWRDTVDAPLDALLETGRTSWIDFIDSVEKNWGEIGCEYPIAQKLEAVSAHIQGLEVIRQKAQEWLNAGRDGSTGISLSRLDWSQIARPLTSRFDIGNAEIYYLPQSFLLAARILHLGVTSTGELLQRQLKCLMELPEERDLCTWLPFFRDLIQPLKSTNTLMMILDNESLRRECIDDSVAGIELPKSSETLDEASLKIAVNLGFNILGDMLNPIFDPILAGINQQLALRKSTQPINLLPNVQSDPASEALCRPKESEEIGPVVDEFACPPSDETIQDVVKSVQKTKPGKSTMRRGAQEKLIAALTKHHKYCDESCLMLDPIGNNALARAVDVRKSTASAFFKAKFKGHSKYIVLCRNNSQLVAALKLLNDEFAPYSLYGYCPHREDD